MQRFPSNLSKEDQRTYRRWTLGFYLSYLAITIVAIALTWMAKPATELTASNEIQASQLKGTASGNAPTAAMAAKQ